MISLTIPGEPVAKARPRVTRSGIAYTPAKTKNYETLVQELFIINYPKQALLDGQLEVKLDAYFTIPKSTSQKRKLLMAKGEIRPTKRPDLDNVAKSVLDALNSLAYGDDSQIVSLNVNKYYSDKPRVEVEITEV